MEIICINNNFTFEWSQIQSDIKTFLGLLKVLADGLDWIILGYAFRIPINSRSLSDPLLC